MLKLEPIEFRSPITTVEFKNGSKIELLFSQVWQRRFKALWEFVAGKKLSATLNFPNTVAGQSSSLTVVVLGVSIGDFAQVSPFDSALIIAGSYYTAFVSDTDEVTVMFVNASAGAINPPEGIFQIQVST